MINGKDALVEGIPASICARCEEATFNGADSSHSV